jgi:hypothetical protein
LVARLGAAYDRASEQEGGAMAKVLILAGDAAEDLGEFVGDTAEDVGKAIEDSTRKESSAK